MIIGIDLGTTFSVGAWVDENGIAHVANSREGGNTTPSVVMFDDNEIIIGKRAKNNAELAPENVVQFVKRNMGDKGYCFLTENGKEFTAEEISAMILRRIKEDCETCIGVPVTEAVITVPAYFSDAQRQSTIDAGKIAGLNVRAIINEPTAAALAYGTSKASAAQRVMVYDLGGGTFDVTIMEIQPDGKVRVLATHGNRNLGGVNFDNELITYVRNRFERETGVENLEEDDEFMQVLRTKCEQAKLDLSGSERTFVTVSAQRKKMKIDITRAVFESLIMPILEETEVDIDITLEDSGLKPRDLDKVLLVGGSSRIPAVRAFVQKKLNITPSAELNPDEVVAIGAAIYGKSLTQPAMRTETDNTVPGVPSEAEKQIFQDVNSHGLGIVAESDITNRPMNFILIPRNQPIPTVGRQTFGTVVDDQTEIELKVTEGDDEELSYVTIIGSAIIEIPPHPTGSPVTIELNYDSNGIITGRVYDEILKKYVGNIEINRSANMSEQEVESSAQRLENENFA